MRYLAIDHGRRRTGLAICDPSETIVSPFAVLDNPKNLCGKIAVVIGAGFVGTSYVYALMQTGLASEIALIDLDKKRVEGEVMDLSHGLPFIPPVKLKMGEYEDCEDAHIIVITAGAKQSPGQTRLELV